MSDEQQTKRLSLEEFLCRKVHDYEWAHKTGTHGAPMRKNPCTECGDTAALVVEWLQVAPADAGLSDRIRAAFLRRFPDLRLPETGAAS